MESNGEIERGFAASKDDLNDLLVRIDSSAKSATCDRDCLEFMYRSLDLIRESLPEVAKSGVDVLGKYLDGSATAADLESARVKCWETIDSLATSGIQSPREISAIRATICCLWTTEEIRKEDRLDLLGVFLDFACDVVPCYQGFGRFLKWLEAL